MAMRHEAVVSGLGSLGREMSSPPLGCMAYFTVTWPCQGQPAAHMILISFTVLDVTFLNIIVSVSMKCSFVYLY